MGKEMLLSSKVLTLIAHKIKLNEFANSIALEEVAQNEPRKF